VFVDMKGYGRLFAEHTNTEAVRVMRGYVEIVRGSLPRKTVEADQLGDEFHLVFSDAGEGIRTANAIVDAFLQNGPRVRGLGVGVGIDLGQTMRVNGRYFGIALANAGALAHRAAPGQILVTQNVLSVVRNEVGAPRDLGPLSFADGRVRVYELRAREPAWRDREATPERYLVTLLFFDMVGSTAKSAEMGAAKWKQTLERHHAVARATLRRFRGVEVDTSGDGFYATFEMPSHAVACAMAMRDALQTELGLDIRAGVHLAECEIIDGKVGGIGVAIAARIMSQGGAGEVLVSQAVRDSLLGTEFIIEPARRTQLKGVSGEWVIYSVAQS
jgi:class 3 adenylate cyclase